MGMVGYSEGDLIGCKKLIATNLGYLIDELRGEGMVLNYRNGKAGPERLRLQEEALEFITSESNNRWSFKWMCDILEIDYGWFMRQVMSGEYMNWRRIDVGSTKSMYTMKGDSNDYAV